MLTIHILYRDYTRGRDDDKNLTVKAVRVVFIFSLFFFPSFFPFFFFFASQRCVRCYTSGYS